MKVLSEFSYQVAGVCLGIWIIKRWYNIFSENFLHCNINNSPLWKKKTARSVCEPGTVRVTNLAEGKIQT